MGTKVKTIASQPNIALRLKKLKGNLWSFFIDDNSKANRSQVSIKIYLDGDKVADAVRKQNALNIFKEYCNDSIRKSYNITTVSRNITLLEYYDKVALLNPNDKIPLFARNHVEKFFGSSKIISEITSDDVELFTLYLLKNIANSTAVTYRSYLLRALRHAFKTGVTRNVIEVKPISNPKKYHKKYLTVSEVESLLRVLDKNNHNELSFMYCVFTGLRYSDVKNLQWNQIRDDAMIIVQKKKQKQNVIPLSKMAFSMLPPQKSSGNVFDLTIYQTVNRHVKKLCERAGIKTNITFHQSRHTFATLLVNKNVNLLTIKELLGHSTLEMTMIYAQLAGTQKKFAVHTLDDFL